MKPEARWYCKIGDQESTIGPLTDSQLRQLARQGTISRSDRVGRAPDGPWSVAEKIRGLFPQVPSDVAPTQSFDQAPSDAAAAGDRGKLCPEGAESTDVLIELRRSRRRFSIWVALTVAMLLLVVMGVAGSLLVSHWSISGHPSESVAQAVSPVSADQPDTTSIVTETPAEEVAAGDPSGENDAALTKTAEVQATPPTETERENVAPGLPASAEVAKEPDPISPLAVQPAEKPPGSELQKADNAPQPNPLEGELTPEPNESLPKVVEQAAEAVPAKPVDAPVEKKDPEIAPVKSTEANVADARAEKLQEWLSALDELYKGRQKRVEERALAEKKLDDAETAIKDSGNILLMADSERLRLRRESVEINLRLQGLADLGTVANTKRAEYRQTLAAIDLQLQDIGRQAGIAKETFDSTGRGLKALKSELRRVDEADGLLNRGWLEHLDTFGKRPRAYQQAVESKVTNWLVGDPTFVHGLLLRGYARIHLDQPKQAEQDFSAILLEHQQSLEKMPGGKAVQVVALCGRSQARTKLGGRDATNDLGLALKIDKQSGLARIVRGGIYEKSGKVRNALDEYEIAIKFMKDEPAGYRIAATLLTNSSAVRNPAKARQYAQKACELSGFKDWSALAVLAAAESVQGEVESAKGHLQQAIEIAPEERIAELRDQLAKLERVVALPKAADGVN